MAISFKNAPSRVRLPQRVTYETHLHTTHSPGAFPGGLDHRLLLLGVSFVVFIILYLSPGDPFSVLLEGQMSTESAREGIREAMGVQKAWYAQYLSWLGNMLQGNFGTSIRTGLPVLGEVLRVGLNTLILTLGSLLVTLLIAVPIALYSRGTA